MSLCQAQGWVSFEPVTDDNATPFTCPVMAIYLGPTHSPDPIILFEGKPHRVTHVMNILDARERLRVRHDIDEPSHRWAMR